MDIDTREGPRLGDAIGAALLACLEGGVQAGTVSDRASVDLRYHAPNQALGRVSGQTGIRVRYRDVAAPYFDYLLATADELRAPLIGTAWMVEEYQQGSSAYGVVLRKTER